MWLTPNVAEAKPGQDLIAVGGDLSAENLLRAYVSGLFPMDVDLGELIDMPALAQSSVESVIGWWSPDPRGVLPLEALQVSKSLRKSCKRYRVTFDLSFEAVMRGCQTGRGDGWITPRYLGAYTELHRLGHAHSVEVRDTTGALVGGLYGVEVGGFFAGESMFHASRDASKVAVVALVDAMLRAGGSGRLLDVQWQTSHLATLGVVEITRSEYLARLKAAIVLPPTFG